MQDLQKSHRSIIISISVLFLLRCELANPQIQIKLHDLPPDVQTLRVCALIQGEPKVATITSSLDAFSIKFILPADFSGPVDLFFEANDADGCAQSLGQGQVIVQENSGSLELNLTARSPALCRVTVETQGVGSGNILLTPNGTSSSCEKNIIYLPKGQVVQAQAETGINSHFYGWLEGCQSIQNGQCSLGSIQGATTLKAQFNLGICTVPNFCWENPLPQGNSLSAVWGPATGSEVWAVGKQGFLLHRDGNGWHSLDANIQQDINDISGSDPNNAWLVGSGGLIRHWDGKQWEQLAGSNVTTKDLLGVFGEFSDSIWASGTKEELIRGVLIDKNKGWSTLGNIKWAELPLNSNGLNDLSRVFGTTSEQIFVVETRGMLFQGNPLNWNSSPPVASCAGGGIQGLWGVPNKVWMAGDGGAIYHYEPGKGCTTDISLGQGTVRSVWGINENSIWAVGNQGLILGFHGKAWQADQSSVPMNLTDVWGRSDQEFWAVGDHGVTLTYHGQNWGLESSTQDPIRQGRPGPFVTLRAVSGQDSNHIWAVGDGGLIFHWDGTRWLEEVNPDPSQNDLYAVWANASDVWAVGNQGTVLHRSDSKGWELWPQPGPIDPRSGRVLGVPSQLFGVAASGGKLWVTGPQGIVWSTASLTGTITWEGQFPIASIKSYFAVWAKDGLTCAASPAPATETNVLCSPQVGADLIEYEFTPVSDTMYAIWGTGPSDIWAAGENTVMHRYDNRDNAWELIHTAKGEIYRGGCRTGDKIWLVGEGGIIRSYEISSKAWVEIPSGTTDNLRGIWCSGQGDIVIVGDHGIILRSLR